MSLLAMQVKGEDRTAGAEEKGVNSSRSTLWGCGMFHKGRPFCSNFIDLVSPPPHSGKGAVQHAVGIRFPRVRSKV